MSRPITPALPENVLSLTTAQHAWNGVHVDVTEFQCTGRVSHHLGRETETRLSVLLEEVGTPCEPRLREDQPCPIGYRPRHMYLAPAGTEIWGYSADLHSAKDVALTFDLPVLSERLATRFDSDATGALRLRFWDDRVWTLVRLLSDAVGDRDPSAQLYGDGLVAAITARLFADLPVSGANGKGLAPNQLGRVLEYLNAHLPQRVELAQLADLAGLSQAHFSRAFKTATGMAPYRWQLDARIRRAQALLLDSSSSLHDVAEATGFADAVHFGRTFRKLTGATPAAWRRDRKG